MKEIITSAAPAAIGPYAQGYISHGMVYTAGQVGFHPEDGSPAEGIEAQADQACRNVGAILQEAGVDYKDVVKTTCFLADMNDFGAFNTVYAKYFTGRPARSCVAVKTLPKGMLCEIEAIAEIPEE